MTFVTIVVPDSAVGIGTSDHNRKFHSELDLSSCGIPENIWALQWSGSSGHIEYVGDAPNLSIDALPDWANACVNIWNAENSKQAVLSIADIKNTADALLESSDWSVLPDVNLANQADWVAYRQQLRVIRSNPTLDAVFPAVPAKTWA